MFNGIGTAGVFVTNQDAAKAFYTGVLGFELMRDDPMYPGATGRWIQVSPAPGAQTHLTLLPLDEQSQHYAGTVGHDQALTLVVTDISRLIETLRGRGVVIAQEPQSYPWGTMALIHDPDGNGLMLIEPPAAG